MNVFNFFGIVIGNCGAGTLQIFNKGPDKIFILKKAESNNYRSDLVALSRGLARSELRRHHSVGSSSFHSEIS